MARRRDLDGWALALDVWTDDDAIVKLAHLSQVVRGLQNDYGALCDRLRGVDERGMAARAADRLDGVQDGLFWVKRDFLLHERGL